MQSTVAAWQLHSLALLILSFPSHGPCLSRKLKLQNGAWVSLWVDCDSIPTVVAPSRVGLAKLALPPPESCPYSMVAGEGWPREAVLPHP